MCRLNSCSVLSQTPCNALDFAESGRERESLQPVPSGRLHPRVHATFRCFYAVRRTRPCMTAVTRLGHPLLRSLCSLDGAVRVYRWGSAGVPVVERQLHLLASVTAATDAVVSRHTCDSAKWSESLTVRPARIPQSRVFVNTDHLLPLPSRSQ